MKAVATDSVLRNYPAESHMSYQSFLINLLAIHLHMSITRVTLFSDLLRDA